MRKNLLFVLLLLCFSSLVYSVKAEKINIVESNIKYIIDTATGEAECSGATSSSVIINNLIIPDFITYDNTAYPVTKIGSQAFYQCSKITGSLTIGSNVKDIEAWAFNGCSGLSGELLLTNSVEYIRYGAFWYCSGFSSIILGSNIKEIGCRTAVTTGSANTGKVFTACTGVQYIKCYSEIPPEMFINNGMYLNFGINAYDNLYSTVTLYVPESSIDKYENATEWKYFKLIEGFVDELDSNDTEIIPSHRVIYMEPGQKIDIKSIFDFDDNTSNDTNIPTTQYEIYSVYSSSNQRVIPLSLQTGQIEALQYGYSQVILTYQSPENVVINNVDIFVCPKIILQYGDGNIYSHHVIYNSKPTLYLSPLPGYRLAGVSHDNTPIDDVLLSNNGLYTPSESVKNNSIINIVLEKSDNGPTTGQTSALSESEIRIYVYGHNVDVRNVTEGKTIFVTNLNGQVIYSGKTHFFNLNDSGIYIIKIQDNQATFKICVK